MIFYHFQHKLAQFRIGKLRLCRFLHQDTQFRSKGLKVFPDECLFIIRFKPNTVFHSLHTWCAWAISPITNFWGFIAYSAVGVANTLTLCRVTFWSIGDIFAWIFVTAFTDCCWGSNFIWLRRNHFAFFLTYRTLFWKTWI